MHSQMGLKRHTDAPKHFMLTAVMAIGPTRLALCYADDQAFDLELGEVIDKHPTLARLRNPDVFAQVVPDEWNRGVVFAGDDNLTLASDNLRAMAIEQRGSPVTCTLCNATGTPSLTSRGRGSARVPGAGSGSATGC